jgi:hypothetical protein
MVSRRYKYVLLFFFLILVDATTAYADTVVLRWDPNTESDLAGYIVSIGNSRGTYTQQVDVGKATTFSFPNATGTATYYFAVQAYNVAGMTSAMSDEVAYVPSGSQTAPPNGTAPLPRPRADFDNDGKSDILWQHVDGWISVWHMDGLSMTSAEYFTPNRFKDTAWQIVGAPDMNRDGRPDLLLRHRTRGLIATWIMNGTTLETSLYLHPGQIEDTRWEIVGSGDFDRDGQVDLIWQHQDGWLAAWMMDGRMLRESVLLNPSYIPPDTWRIVGSGDFDGDRNPDVLWEHKDGWLAAWFMDGTNLRSAELLDPAYLPPGTWRIRGVADLNRDGYDDIIWQHADGWLATWYMRGNAVLDTYLLQPNWLPPGTWTIMGPR